MGHATGCLFLALLCDLTVRPHWAQWRIRHHRSDHAVPDNSMVHCRIRTAGHTWRRKTTSHVRSPARGQKSKQSRNLNGSMSCLNLHECVCTDQHDQQMRVGFMMEAIYEVKKGQNEWDIQQLKFAGGHPPNYYAAGRMLKYARADGMACSHSPVVVCDRIGFQT